jgi:hypothetical protein
MELEIMKRAESAPDRLENKKRTSPGRFVTREDVFEFHFLRGIAVPP